MTQDDRTVSPWHICVHILHFWSAYNVKQRREWHILSIGAMLIAQLCCVFFFSSFYSYFRMWLWHILTGECGLYLCFGNVISILFLSFCIFVFMHVSMTHFGALERRMCSNGGGSSNARQCYVFFLCFVCLFLYFCISVFVFMHTSCEYDKFGSVGAENVLRRRRGQQRSAVLCVFICIFFLVVCVFCLCMWVWHWKWLWWNDASKQTANTSV